MLHFRHSLATMQAAGIYACPPGLMQVYFLINNWCVNQKRMLTRVLIAQVAKVAIISVVAAHARNKVWEVVNWREPDEQKFQPPES